MSLPILPPSVRQSFRDVLMHAVLTYAVLMLCATSALAADDMGKVIYQQRCASCHGTNGEGVEDVYDKPLFGEHSIDELAKLIERTMPEDDPEACVGHDAFEVAKFVYHEFYSLEARRKQGRAARIELLRLTVPQYRNAVADLIGHFTPPPKWESRGRRRASRDAEPIPSEAGLLASYYQSKGMSKADDLRQRSVDQRVDFDFAEGGPAEDIDAEQFAVVWQGSVYAEDTGDYEFRIRSQNGARLYLNNDRVQYRRKLRDDSSVAGQSAFIDAWVSSGKMRETSSRMFLLGGRRYPLRLEFFKYKEKTASIRLEWKPPHGTWSVLDHRHLRTDPAPRVFVVETVFPADDRSLGYERGSSTSNQWHAATTNAAIATASEVIDRLPLLAKLDDDSPNRSQVLREFVLNFARVAFRRPLSDQETRLFGAVMFADVPTAEAAVRRAVLAILMSPNFLYTDLTPAGEQPSPHTIASRLSFSLWDSIPDAPLLAAAEKGQLHRADQVETHARRMISDTRARAKVRGFFHHWLEIEERDLDKDTELFPQFDENVVADLRYSLEAFLEQVVWSDASDYRQLLLADHLVLNERLRRLYQPGADDQPGEDADGGSPELDASNEDGTTTADGDVQRRLAQFERVAFPPERRAGVLTHPYLLSVFAYHDNTSPIHRGVFLTRNIVGRGLKPPPVAVAFKNDEFEPDLTMREKITQLTRDKACMSCHSVINPLGFALENYDAIGRWRTTDNNKPVNAASEYTTVDGKILQVQSARDIANFAVTSDSAQRAFVRQLFQHLTKQDPNAYGADVVDRLRHRFAEDDFHIQHLIIQIVTMCATHGSAEQYARAPERDSITKRGESGD